MNYKGVILILVVVIIFIVGAVAYLWISQPAENATLNVTNNTTSTDNSEIPDQSINSQNICCKRLNHCIRLHGFNPNNSPILKQAHPL